MLIWYIQGTAKIGYTQRSRQADLSNCTRVNVMTLHTSNRPLQKMQLAQSLELVQRAKPLLAPDFSPIQGRQRFHFSYRKKYFCTPNKVTALSHTPFKRQTTTVATHHRSEILTPLHKISVQSSLYAQTTAL